MLPAPSCFCLQPTLPTTRLRAACCFSHGIGRQHVQRTARKTGRSQVSRQLSCQLSQATSSADAQAHSLDVLELCQPVLALLPPHAALLHAPKRRYLGCGKGQQRCWLMHQRKPGAVQSQPQVCVIASFAVVRLRTQRRHPAHL